MVYRTPLWSALKSYTRCFVRYFCPSSRPSWSKSSTRRKKSTTHGLKVRVRSKYRNTCTRGSKTYSIVLYNSDMGVSQPQYVHSKQHGYFTLEELLNDFVFHHLIECHYATFKLWWVFTSFFKSKTWRIFVFNFSQYFCQCTVFSEHWVVFL